MYTFMLVLMHISNTKIFGYINNKYELECNYQISLPDDYDETIIYTNYIEYINNNKYSLIISISLNKKYIKMLIILHRKAPILFKSLIWLFYEISGYVIYYKGKLTTILRFLSSHKKMDKNILKILLNHYYIEEDLTHFINHTNYRTPLIKHILKYNEQPKNVLTPIYYEYIDKIIINKKIHITDVYKNNYSYVCDFLFHNISQRVNNIVYRSPNNIYIEYWNSYVFDIYMNVTDSIVINDIIKCKQKCYHDNYVKKRMIIG